MSTDRRFVDLHTHSTASDGAMAPEALVELAAREQLRALALTDHDTIDGLAAASLAAAECPELLFIGGIEISAQFTGGTMHILGLGLNADSPALGPLLTILREARNQRNPKIVAKLQSMGMNVTMDDVLEAAQTMGGPAANADTATPPSASPPAAAGQNGGLGVAPKEGHARIIGRPHIAEAMRRKGLIASVAEAFEKYLANGKPAYVDKERLTPRQAIEGIHSAGAVAVLAHPVQLNCENSAQLLRILRDLKHGGLDGIEAYHSQHSIDQTRMYIDLAKDLGLIVTGGSDFHGPAKPDVRIGHPRVPAVAVGEELLARLAAR